MSTVFDSIKLSDPAIRSFYLQCAHDEQELFDERAGILEYDAGLLRARAEHKAFMEILNLRRAKRENI